NIAATSVNIEHCFSRSRLLLLHTRNRLLSQSTRTLLCLGSWSLMGLVKDEDIRAITVLDDLDGPEEALEDGWDAIPY
ncbi:hypothetical protein GLOTRDRAFT_22647, partial [Gloeophyllum trabeum ATCC 11539]